MISIRKNFCIREIGFGNIKNRELFSIAWLRNNKYSPIEFGINLSSTYESPLHLGINIWKTTIYLGFFAIKCGFFDD